MRQAARALFNIVVVAAFIGVVVATVSLYDYGCPWLVCISAPTVLTIVAVAFFGPGTWRERIAVSLCVPLFPVGGYVGLRICLAMYRFAWFQAIFPGKGGFFAVSLFAGGFGSAFFLAAAYCIYRLYRVLWPTTSSPTNVEQSENGNDDPRHLL
jgi:hypothetical protein